MSSALPLLQELIALPSVNPAFLPEDDPRTGEARVAEHLARVARKAGLEVEFQPVLPGRRNVLVRLTPKGKVRRRILLAPHLDTVGGAAELDGLLKPQKRGERLYGRGACDTKGSVAAMFTAVLEVARTRNCPQATEIIFAGLMDEENGQCGSRALAASRFKADLAIVGEPTELRVVTAHKGDLWLKLITRGKAAHGARPELGRNAVHAMARVVEALETDYARALKRKRHPVLGPGTVNVGYIRGGQQANIVPDYCSITIDRRTIPGETETGVRREINALLRARGLQAEIANTKSAPCLPMETSPRLPLVSQFLNCAGQRAALGVDYFCDASVLSRGGIPSVVFGPGNIAQAHTVDEWIAIPSLERGTRMLISFLLSQP